MIQAGIETPNYELTKYIEPTVQIRKYYASEWVYTDLDDRNIANQVNCKSLMFGKLIKYISGQNSYRERIEMTAPLLVSYKQKTSANNFQMSMELFLPRRLHGNTPYPIMDNMFIKSMPAQLIAIIRFSHSNPGYDDYLKYRDALVNRLGHLAAGFDSINFTTASYNTPSDPVQIHEVWLRKKE
jgi:hypothetical protein